MGNDKQPPRIGKLYVEKDRTINLSIVFVALLILYHYRYTLTILNPTRDSWVMIHDWAQHYLGWFFFRQEPWGFPLGKISNFLYPVATNVGFLDSIPMAAIFFKIFAPILPDKFQYLGPWLFMCHLLVGYFSIRLFELFSVRGLAQLAGVLLIVFNPMLLHRSIHPALCSQWLIIGSLWVYFLDPRSYGATRLLVYQGIFLLVGSLINPYYSLFEAGFMGALALRIWWVDKTLSFSKTAVITTSFVLGLFFAWYCFGFFQFTNKVDLGVSGGYGLYAFNLNSFYNSGGWSDIFYGYPTVSWHQYESFMYLGAGMMGLLLLVLILWVVYIVRKKFKPEIGGLVKNKSVLSILPLIIFVVVIMAFAVTNVITYNDRVLITFHLPGMVQKLCDVFRASARYAWVLYYLIYILTILALVRLIRNRTLAVMVLAGAFSLQLYDYHRLVVPGPAADVPVTYHPPLKESVWRALFQRTDKILFYPPFEATYLTDTDYRYFSYLAADCKKPIDLGYTARADNYAMEKFSDELKTIIDEGAFENTLFVTTEKYVGRFSVPYQAGLLSCAEMDGYYVLYPHAYEDDPAFAGLHKTTPPILRGVSRKTLPGEVFTEATMLMNINWLEVSPKALFVRGWLLTGNLAAPEKGSIFLKSEKNAYTFPLDSLMEIRQDTLHFEMAALTGGLEPGNYDLGVLLENGQKRIVVFISPVAVNKPAVVKVTDSGVPSVHVWLDQVVDRGDYFKLRGWAFINGQPGYGNRIEVLLRSGDRTYHAATSPDLRPDVTSYFGSAVNLETSGFTCSIDKQGLQEGVYEIILRIVNDHNHLEGIENTGKVLSVKKPGD